MSAPHAKVVNKALSQVGNQQASGLDNAAMTASFSEDGYQQVVDLEDDMAMANYVRRFLDSRGMKVQSESELEGFVPWYSGTRSIQTLNRMRAELETKPWVVAKDKSAAQAQTTSRKSVLDISDKPLPQNERLQATAGNTALQQHSLVVKVSDDASKTKIDVGANKTSKNNTASARNIKSAKIANASVSPNNSRSLVAPNGSQLTPKTQDARPRSRIGNLTNQLLDDLQEGDKELVPFNGSDGDELHVKAEPQKRVTPLAAHEAKRHMRQRANISGKEKLYPQHRLRSPERGDQPSGRLQAVPSITRQAHRHTVGRSHRARRTGQHGKREPLVVSDNHPQESHARAVDKVFEHAGTDAISHVKTTSHGVAKVSDDHPQASHALADNKAAEQAGTKSTSNVRTTSRDVADVMHEASQAASSMFSGLSGIFHRATEPLVSYDKHELDTKQIPLADNQVGFERPVEAANPTKAVQILSGKIPTVFARTPLGDKTNENRHLERKNSLDLMAKPQEDKSYFSSQAIKTAKADEAKEPKPSLDTTVMVIPKAEKISNTQVSFRSPQSHQLSKTPQHASSPVVSFDAKLTVPLVADNASTADAPDRTLHDVVQPSDSRVLPEVPSLLDKPTHVLDALNKQVIKLKEHLAAAESESQTVVANKRSEYERILEHQIQNSTSMMEANEQLGREIQNLREQNSELRDRAMHLKAKGAQLRKHMLDLQANLSLAQEYVTEAFESHSNDNTALLVLRELDEQDAALAKANGHASALRQVAGALLQTSSSRTGSSDVLEVVRDLGKRFDDLDREKTDSMAALKQHFNDQFSKELQHQKDLNEDSYRLTTNRDKLLALREELQAAVNHLEHAVSSLSNQIQGLEAYAVKLASEH